MTLLRKAENRALAGIRLSGKVLDLGGEHDSGYRKLFDGEFATTVVNLSKEAKPDVVADLEKPLPFPDASHDGVLLMNVLEHVFEYRALLLECARITAPGGRIVIAVPFLFPVHPSPDDFHRFSASALSRALSAAGFSASEVTPLAAGVFSARYLMLERLLPGMLQDILGIVLHPVVRGFDILIGMLVRLIGKKYRPEDYPLGYIAVATRS